ncbi:hypothetical protein ACIF6H_36595 [Streptomyces microflavus]|uniref:hypothetical protein n=1 Tax=Streptomyces microflavus TaxID=1919 RepID=UPI0037CE00E6
MTARLTRWAGLCAAVPLALALAAFGGADDPVPPPAAPPAPSSPTPSVDPDAAEKTAVLKAYEGMWAARNRSYATAKLDPELETYAGNKALSNIKATLFYHQQQSTVMKGEPTRAPQVDSVDETRAALTDCVDTSDYTEVYVKTGKTVPVGTGPRRHHYTASAIKTGGKWVIWTTTIERDRTC